MELRAEAAERALKDESALARVRAPPLPLFSVLVCSPIFSRGFDAHMSICATISWLRRAHVNLCNDLVASTRTCQSVQRSIRQFAST
jgi:hypothetical protein